MSVLRRREARAVHVPRQVVWEATRHLGPIDLTPTRARLFHFEAPGLSLRRMRREGWAR